MREMTLFRGVDLGILRAVVSAIKADSSLLENSLHSTGAYIISGVLKLDACDVEIAVTLLPTGKIEDMRLQLLLPGRKDTYYVHQGLRRFVVETSDVRWTAWVRDGKPNQDAEFSLRGLFDDLHVEGQYSIGFKRDMADLSAIAIVDPNSGVDRENLVFSRAAGSNDFCVKTPGRPIVRVSLSSDGDNPRVEWDEHFISRKYTIIEADQLVCREDENAFVLEIDGVRALVVPKAVSIPQARTLMHETIKTLQELSTIIQNNTHLTT